LTAPINMAGVEFCFNAIKVMKNIYYALKIKYLRLSDE